MSCVIRSDLSRSLTDKPIFKYKKSENATLATAQKLEDEALQLPEPSPLMSAKMYKAKAWDLSKENCTLKVQLRDFDRIKEYLGIDKVQEM